MTRFLWRLIVAGSAFTIMVPWLWAKCWEGAGLEFDGMLIPLDDDVMELTDEGLERLWADIEAVLEDERGTN